MNSPISSHPSMIELSPETIGTNSEYQCDAVRSTDALNVSDTNVQMQQESASHPNEYEGINSIFFNAELDVATTSEAIAEDDIDDDDGAIDPLCTFISDADVMLKLEVPSESPKVNTDCCSADEDLIVDLTAAEKPKDSNGNHIFTCKLCTFTSSAKQNLCRHTVCHPRLGEEPFACDFCSFKSFSRTSLREHVAIHARKRLFHCELCPYKTVHTSALKKHALGHSGQKRFKCKYCMFATCHVGNLKSHLMLHTGEKPFACERCSYKTNQKSALKRHITKNSTEANAYACEFCAFKSCAKSTFKTHVSEHNAE